MKVINPVFGRFLFADRDRATTIPVVLMCFAGVLHVQAKPAVAGTVLADLVTAEAAIFAGNAQGQLYRIDRDSAGDFVSQTQIGSLPGPIRDIAFRGPQELFAMHGPTDNQQITRIGLDDSGEVGSTSTWHPFGNQNQLQRMAFSPDMRFLFYTRQVGGVNGRGDTVERIAVLPDGSAGSPVVVASHIPYRHFGIALRGLAFDKDLDGDKRNHLYVAEIASDQILRVIDPFAPSPNSATNRQVVHAFGASNLASIAFDRNNNVFVTDFEFPGRLTDHEIRTNGLAVYLETAAIRSGDPWDIAIDGDRNGALYFTFIDNGYIQRQLRNSDGSRSGPVQDFTSGLGGSVVIAFQPNAHVIPEPHSLVLISLGLPLLVAQARRGVESTTRARFS